MDFKDYYAILEIGRYSSYEDIKTAYRVLSKKWHPDLNQGKDVVQKMQDINEAYAILKDSVKKARYDFEYDNYYRLYRLKKEDKHFTDSYPEYVVRDEHLKQDINVARKYAEDLVSEFLRSLKETSKVAAKGAWGEAEVYLLIGIIMSIVSTMILTCSN